MARRTSASHVTWCFALLLSGGLVPASAQVPQDDLSGAWGSNIGLSYAITQNGNQVAWTDSAGVKGTIVSTATGLSTTWSDAGGQHSATGTIVERDNAGRPAKIAWSNGVVFQRAATFGAQIAKPVYQVAPAAPPPAATPTVHAVPNIQGIHLQGATVLASTTSPSSDEGRALLSIQDSGKSVLQAVSLQAVSLRFGPEPSTQAGGVSLEQPAGLGPISISKAVDATSPLIMEAAASGKKFQSGQISLGTALAGQTRTFLTLTLQPVVVVSYTATAEPGAESREEFLLQYSDLTYRVRDVDANTGKIIAEREVSVSRTHPMR
jgi:type VI protein secretion system component Hcp